MENVEKSSGKSNAKPRGRPDWVKGQRHPDQGTGPKRNAPNAGRPRDEWKAWLRSIVDAPESREAIVAVLNDPAHPAYPRVLQWAAERGYGKETETVEHSGRDGAPIAITVTRRVIRPTSDG